MELLQLTMQVFLNAASVTETFFLTSLSIMMKKVRWSRTKLFSMCPKSYKTHKDNNQMKGKMKSQRNRMRRYKKIRDRRLVYLLPK